MIHPRLKSANRLLAGILGPLLGCTAFAQPLSPLNFPDRVRYDGQMLVQVELRSVRDLMLVNQISDDCWSHSAGPAIAGGMGTLDYRMDAAGLRTLREAGMTCRVLDPNLQRTVDEEAIRLQGAGDGRFGPRGWYDDFKSPQQVSDFANQLIAMRPDLASRQNFGLSLQNRDLYFLRLSGEPAPPGTSKPIVLLNSVQHAREWITVMTTMYIAEQLISGYGVDSRATQLLDDYEVLIVPIVNADGYAYTWTNERFWRKNRRQNAGGTFGVDLNRNWSFAWGSDNGSSGNGNSETFRGTAPFSEPESAAMRTLTLDNPGIVLHLDVHSHGQLLLYPWGYTNQPAPGIGALSKLAVGMRQAILDSGGVPYLPGQCYQTLYPVSGGSLDWYYGDRGILSWTPELRGPGFAPPPSTILPTAKEIYAAVLWLAENFCEADFDQSGFMDTDDFDAFVYAFEEGLPKTDFNHSGFVDTDDFDAFVAAFIEGC